MKYYYIFQIYKDRTTDGNLNDLTTVEVLGESYSEAEAEMKKLLKTTDERLFRLSQIVVRDLEAKNPPR